MTYNFKDTRLPMERIQTLLAEQYKNSKSYTEIASLCSTTPSTIKKWIAHGPDLKWYSLLDICEGLDIKLSDVLKDTRWEKLL